jgi:hypothetical protein
MLQAWPSEMLPLIEQSLTQLRLMAQKNDK